MSIDRDTEESRGVVPGARGGYATGMRTGLALLLLCCACGRADRGAAAGGPTGRSDAQGTLQGRPFTASDSLSYVGTDAAGNSFLTVWVSSFPSACGLASQNAGIPNASVLVLNLQGQRSAATQPGVYTIGAAPEGRTAQAAALRTDETCRATPLAVGAASGTVTIASIGASGASGTFDLHLGDDRISGGFEGVACPAAPLSARAPATSCRVR